MGDRGTRGWRDRGTGGQDQMGPAVMAALEDSLSLVLSLSSSLIPSIMSSMRSLRTETPQTPYFCPPEPETRIYPEPRWEKTLKKTFDLLEIEVFFGCLGKFIDLRLQLDDHQNWEGTEQIVMATAAVAAVWRWALLTPLSLSTSFPQLLCFVLKLGVFLVDDLLKFCKGKKTPLISSLIPLRWCPGAWRRLGPTDLGPWWREEPSGVWRSAPPLVRSE